MRTAGILALLLFLSCHAYTQHYTRADSLRGSLGPYRSNFDVRFYDLKLRIYPSEKRIAGSNTIRFTAVRDLKRIQLDLFENMEISKIVMGRDALEYQRDGNAFFISFPNTIREGTDVTIEVFYHGRPKAAQNPPWDGGFVWRQDKKLQPWIGVACEGIGASLWWPNKDHLSDEPDSMRITCEVPSNLICIANGELRSRHHMDDGYTSYEWGVSYPINNYNVTLNIGDYAYFSDYFTYQDGEKLRLKYYVLNYNLEKAKKQFRQVKDMFACFEQLYGKYPFANDGYSLVETSYWGMEHQGAIAYGNNYKNNSFGFDFIIIHESGHEYWGNSVSARDHGELWIHESWTTYTDALFVECHYGHTIGQKYLDSMKMMIKNRQPILGPLEVNYDGWNDADMYYKGAWMLHSIRNTIHDDEVWFGLLKDLYQNYSYQNVESEDIISFIDNHTSFNLRPIFEQYLRYPDPPVLTYWLDEDGKETILNYKWIANADNFRMPVRIKTSQEDHYMTLDAGTNLQQKVIPVKGLQDVIFDQESFYFRIEKQ